MKFIPSPSKFRTSYIDGLYADRIFFGMIVCLEKQMAAEFF